MARARRRTLSPPGSDAVQRQAAVDAVVHHRPDPVEAGVDGSRAAACASSLARFIAAIDKPACLGHAQHLGGAVEGIGPAGTPPSVAREAPLPLRRSVTTKPPPIE